MAAWRTATAMTPPRSGAPCSHNMTRLCNVFREQSFLTHRLLSHLHSAMTWLLPGPHFTVGETEARGGKTPWTRSHRDRCQVRFSARTNRKGGTRRFPDRRGRAGASGVSQETHRPGASRRASDLTLTQPLAMAFIQPVPQPQPASGPVSVYPNRNTDLRPSRPIRHKEETGPISAGETI